MDSRGGEEPSLKRAVGYNWLLNVSILGGSELLGRKEFYGKIRDTSEYDRRHRDGGWRSAELAQPALGGFSGLVDSWRRALLSAAISKVCHLLCVDC